MKDILVLCPQERDFKAIAPPVLNSATGFASQAPTSTGSSPSTRRPSSRRPSRCPADGVVGTKDQSALLAALLAERRGLPGPSPQALIASSTSRPPGRSSARWRPRPRRASPCSTRAAVPVPVLRQAGRRAALAERLPDRRRATTSCSSRGGTRHAALRGDRRARRRRPGDRHRLPRRGAARGRRGDARGLRARRARDGDRRSPTRSSTRGRSASSASSTRARCRRSARPSWPTWPRG